MTTTAAQNGRRVWGPALLAGAVAIFIAGSPSLVAYGQLKERTSIHTDAITRLQATRNVGTVERTRLQGKIEVIENEADNVGMQIDSINSTVETLSRSINTLNTNIQLLSQQLQGTR